MAEGEAVTVVGSAQVATLLGISGAVLMVSSAGQVIIIGFPASVQEKNTFFIIHFYAEYYCFTLCI